LYEVDFNWAGFEWIDFHDADHSIVSFLRRAKNPEEFVVFICNFTPMVEEQYRIGVPEAGYYVELLNSDAAIYGGRNFGNGGGVQSETTPWQGRPFSVNLTIPPLAVLVLKVAR
jgi:1,4-alpha-glucan branching enzyme